MKYGLVLKTLRERAGITQAELARRLNVDRSYVCRCEKDTSLWGEELILKYCRALGVNPQDALFDANRFPTVVANRILDDKDFFDFICMASKLDISSELWQSMRSTLESFATKKDEG